MKTGMKLRSAMAVTMTMLSASMLLAYNHSARADQYFPRTGANIWGPFETYWKAHGGISQFGMPRTAVYPAAKNHDAQWFERALFTYNPNNPDPHKVELQLLGSISAANRKTEAPFQPTQDNGQGLFFAATSHNLSGKLLDHWQRTGGLQIYGYPISEAFQERSKSDGKMYTVQYFERNRFELHPELAGTPHEVQLGLLGSEMLDAQGGPAAFSNLGRPAFYPPPTKASIPPGIIVGSPSQGAFPPRDGTVPTAPALPATSAQVHFQDDFSSSDLGGWQPTADLGTADAKPAQWRASRGMLEQWSDYTEADTDTEALLVTEGQTFGNFIFDTHLYATSGEPVGAVVRHSDSGFYLVKLYGQVANSAPKAELLKVSDGRATRLATSQAWAGYRHAAWHRLTIVAQGSSLTVQVDGQTVMQARDASLSKGGIGLYSYANGTAKFDNVRVTAPARLTR